MTIQVLIDGEIIVAYIDPADWTDYTAGQTVVAEEAEDDQNL